MKTTEDYNGLICCLERRKLTQVHTYVWLTTVSFDFHDYVNVVRNKCVWERELGFAFLSTKNILFVDCLELIRHIDTPTFLSLPSLESFLPSYVVHNFSQIQKWNIDFFHSKL